MKKISLPATFIFLVSFSYANNSTVKGSFLIKNSYMPTPVSLVDSKIKKIAINKSKKKSIISAMFNSVDSLELSKKSIVLTKR